MINTQKRYLQYSHLACILFIFLIPCFFSCEKKSISFGENLAESYTNIIVIDSVTPQITTIRSDSFLTNNTGILQIGNFNDAVFGSINARSYFQLNLPPVTAIPTDAIFDSLTLRMQLTKDFYGDTSVVQQVNVNELTSKLDYSGNNNGFYNTSFIPFSTTPLGSAQFSPRPNRIDSLVIRLADSKGQEILRKIKNQDIQMSQQTYFLQYLRGLTVSTSSKPSSIISYSATDSTLLMRLYYTEKGVVFSHKYLDFKFTNPELQFKQITLDRSNTVLASIPKNTEIPSKQLNNAAYLQSLTGVVTKISFPTLSNLLLIKQTGKILKAQLFVRPLSGTYDNNRYRLPPQLNLITTDKTNGYGSALTDPSSTSSTAQTGNLTIDNIYQTNTNYTFDVTSYLQQQIHVNPALLDGLLLYPPTSVATRSFTRLVIGDNTTANKSKIQLKIFFLAVD
jgi:hypothetical protein